MMNTRLRLVLEASVVPLFLVGAVLAQIRYDSIKQEHFDLRAPVHRFVMPAPVVRHLAFGFENILADYYWINAVQDINKWDYRDAYYPEYFRIISTLDPHFEYPYIFAILTVPSRKNPEALDWLSIAAEKGMETFPENWEIPFYLGVQYHVVGKSNERSVHYLEIAASKKTSPEVVQRTLGVYLMHDRTEYQRSRALFSAIYETTDNEMTKRVAEERIALLDFVETIEQAALAYKAKYKIYPGSVGDLDEKGFIQLPTELKKYYIKIDPSTGKVLFER